MYKKVFWNQFPEFKKVGTARLLLGDKDLTFTIKLMEETHCIFFVHLCLFLIKLEKAKCPSSPLSKTKQTTKKQSDHVVQRLIGMTEY